MNTKTLFAGLITVQNAGIFNGTTKATLRDDAGEPIAEQPELRFGT